MQDFQHKISSFGAGTSFKSKICCYRLQGTCAPYNGTVCKQVLGNEVILLNASYGNPGLEQDSQVNELMQGVLSSMVRKPNCQAAALKVFCRHVFPGCTEETGKAKPIHLCKYVFSCSPSSTLLTCLVLVYDINRAFINEACIISSR